MTDAAPTPAATALRGLCPRCAAPTLYNGFASFQPKCRACGLDYSSFNVGDGPAAFLTLIVGALITALAIGVELTLKPPMWVHVLLWFPLTMVAVAGSLRPHRYPLRPVLGTLVKRQRRHRLAG